VTELGISLGLSPRESIDRFVGLLRSAEEQGVDAAWIIDSQMAMKDAYMALAVSARETERLQLGPGVTNLVVRDETVVANAMATLASIAPGRVNVGVGSGDSAVFPLGRKPLKVDECREALPRLRALLRGEAIEGRAGELKLAFTPEPTPPLYFAGSQPRMLQTAGAVADGVIIMGPADPDSVRAQLAHVDAGARAAGREPSDIVRDLSVTISIDDDPVKATNDVKSWGSAQARWLNTWKELPQSLERFRPECEHAAATYDFGEHLSLHADHAGTVSDEFAKVLAVAGDARECEERLAGLIATGVDRLTLTLLSGGRERRLADIAAVWKSLAAQTVA
jgi:5,10-methylenetetrahydromethanopterin reductase